jgi:hypothetical protein
MASEVEIESLEIINLLYRELKKPKVRIQFNSIYIPSNLILKRKIIQILAKISDYD